MKAMYVGRENLRVKKKIFIVYIVCSIPHIEKTVKVEEKKNYLKKNKIWGIQIGNEHYTHH